MPSREVRYTHRVRMDYSKNKLENPFHKTNRGIKRDELSATLKVSCLAALLLLIGLIYLMFFSNVFVVKKFQISGLSRTDSGEIERMASEQRSQRRYWLFKQDNLLMFDKKALSQALADKYHFKDIKVKKSWLHTLKIVLSEREYGYIWQEKDKYYYIDKEGYLISELAVDLPPTIINTEIATTSSSTATSTEASTTEPISEEYYKLTIESVKKANKDAYPIIVNIGEEHFKGDRVDIDLGYLAFASQLIEKIKANNEPDLGVKYFLIDKDFNTMKAILDSGLTVYFSTKEDKDNQIRNLLVLKKELKGDFNKIIKKKIDLRYGDKVYYE